MTRNKYSIYYDHIGYQLIEWEIPEDIELDPKLGLGNYDAMRWGIEHGIFDLIPIVDYNDNGEELDADGDTFDEQCLRADLWHDDFSDYMIPFYEFRILEAGHGAYCNSLEESLKHGPSIIE